VWLSRTPQVWDFARSADARDTEGGASKRSLLEQVRASGQGLGDAVVLGEGVGLCSDCTLNARCLGLSLANTAWHLMRGICEG
jgi:hypothetical protein